MNLHRITWIAPACLAAATFAQEPKVEPPKVQPRITDNAAQSEAAKEMVELFQKVERRLGEIDKLLYQASSGERRLATPQEAGIGELLKSSNAKSQEVVKDIDRILQIAAQNGGT